jgi:DNA-binding MarR family transcriptional regulator
MNFRQLESFLTIAELGSFAAAADRLCVTQSTISARIQELEQILGVELFDRSQRTARLTLKGRELIGYAEQIVDLASEIRRRVGSKDALAGVVRVGVAELVAISWLPNLVNAVRTNILTSNWSSRWGSTHSFSTRSGTGASTWRSSQAGSLRQDSRPWISVACASHGWHRRRCSQDRTSLNQPTCADHLSSIRVRIRIQMA